MDGFVPTAGFCEIFCWRKMWNKRCRACEIFRSRGKWNEINPLTPAGISHGEAIFHTRSVFLKSRKGFISLKKARFRVLFSGSIELNIYIRIGKIMALADKLYRHQQVKLFLWSFIPIPIVKMLFKPSANPFDRIPTKIVFCTVANPLVKRQPTLIPGSHWYHTRSVEASNYAFFYKRRRDLKIIGDRDPAFISMRGIVIRYSVWIIKSEASCGRVDLIEICMSL